MAMEGEWEVGMRVVWCRDSGPDRCCRRKNVIIPVILQHFQEQRNMLDAARECVLAGKLEGKYLESVRTFLVKFDGWRHEVGRSYGRASSVKKAI